MVELKMILRLLLNYGKKSLDGTHILKINTQEHMEFRKLFQEVKWQVQDLIEPLIIKLKLNEG
jgi:hypothetical protein